MIACIAFIVGIALWILLAAYFHFSGKTAAAYEHSTPNNQSPVSQ